MNKPKHSAGRGYRHALHRRVTWTLLAVLFISWGGPSANAFWQSLSSSNFGAAKADTMPQGGAPAGSLSGTNVTVSWAAATTAGGHAVAGYTVARYSAPSGGTKVAAGGGCTGTVSGISCVEQNLPGGTWYYTVTPVISLWTGAESTRSAGVNTDSTPPTISVTSISPTPNGAGYNNTSPVTVNLSAVDNTGGSGVANIKYAVDDGSTVTVNAATAAVNVTGDGTHSVSYTATDVAGNTSNTLTQAVKIDTSAPSVNTISAPAYVNIANKANVLVSGTTEAGASITVTVTDTASPTQHTASQTVTANGSGIWSTSGLDVSLLKEGTVTYSAVAKDAAGNIGGALTTTSTKDTVAPTVSSITMANGGTQKVADIGDTLTIVYSTDTDARTLCSSWDTSSPTNTVTGGTASISASDVLTFTSPTCGTPSFGSVALVGDYNSGTTPLNFVASMTWTPSSGTLVIKFTGAGAAGGTPATVNPQQTPVYTPAPGVADKAANPIGTISAGGGSRF